MGKIETLAVSVGLLAALAVHSLINPPTAAGQSTQPPNGPSASPVFVDWPLPAADQAYESIDGRHLWQYVKQQAAIAEHYRDQGHPQFWGRITGTSADLEDARWLSAKYRQIGLSDTHIQTVALFLPQWAPRSWDVTASAAGKTVQLTSAQPPYGSPSTNGAGLDLPAVYVGLGSEADFAGRDIRGKAVLFFRAQLEHNMVPADVVKRAEEKGAAAIFGSDLRGGNYKVQSYRAYTHVPTFQPGTEDALTLRDLIANAPPGHPPRVQIRLDAEWVSGQKSFLVWGTLPGATDETIYVIAHRDGWFDAAGDNASGVATMLGLAEYFAKVPQRQRRRTMIFIGTDGHHQVRPGWFGASWLVANRDRFFVKTALMINAEHPSEVLTHQMTAGSTDALVPLEWYAGGSSRPQLEKMAVDVFREFGVPIWAQPSKAPPAGDLAPFAWFLPGAVAQSNDFMYMHTTGDTPDNVAWSGLEAITRAYAKLVDEVNQLPLSDLQRPAEQDQNPNAPDSPRMHLDLTNCTAWVRDSTKDCRAN
jgi:hypothetical protein